MKIGLFLVLTLSLGTIGCKKKEAAAAVTGIGDTEVTVLTSTGLAGSLVSSCRTISSGLLSGKSYKDGYVLQANGNYNYYMTVVDSATCAAGATELIRYTQFGTFSVEGLATTPTTASKIKFSVGSAAFNTPDATYRTYFNDTTYCGTPSLNLVGTSNSTVSTSGRSCTGYSPFPTYTNSYYNNFIKSGTSLQAYSGSTLWDSGTSSYPSSVNTTYTYY